MPDRILVVEDDRFIREIVATALTVEGYSVDVAEDGEQAWRYLSSQQPELVVLDIALPVIDGLTICRKLRARDDSGRTPVLVVSALTNRSIVRAALEAGADDFLDKPFDLSDLVGKVQALLGTARTARVDSADSATAQTAQL